MSSVNSAQLSGSVDVAALLHWAQQQAKAGARITPQSIRVALAQLTAVTGNRITKVGEAWEIVYQGKILSGIRDVKGLAYLQFLLAREGQWFDVLELTAQVEPAGAVDANPELNAMTDEQQEEASLYLHQRSDCRQEHFDAKAKAQLLKAKTELEEDLVYMQANPEVASQKEQDEVVEKIAKLQQALGFRGNSRTFSDSKDKARKRISKLITEVIQERLAPRHPALAQHLKAFINMGFNFSYTPEESKQWQTTATGIATPKVANLPRR